MSNAGSNVDFLNAGSIHQGSKRFKGQKMLFYVFSTLLHAHSLVVVHWRAQTNDRIFEEGDIMYLNALENQVIPFSEMRSLNYLPNNYNVPLDAKFILESNS